MDAIEISDFVHLSYLYAKSQVYGGICHGNLGRDQNSGSVGLSSM